MKKVRKKRQSINFTNYFIAFMKNHNNTHKKLYNIDIVIAAAVMLKNKIKRNARLIKVISVCIFLKNVLWSKLLSVIFKY